MAKAVMPIPPEKSDEDNLRADFLKHFNHTFGRDNFDASPQYLATAFALTIRDRITANWSATRHERTARVLPVNGIPFRSAASRCIA